MTGSERERLKDLIDAAKRARLARASWLPEPTVPAVPVSLVPELLDERPKRAFRGCVYCGAPTYGVACRAHRDLPRIERQLVGASA